MKKELNIYAILLLLFFIFINNNAYARRASARDKACFSNIRVIQGAVEMYNMDVNADSMMRNLDIDILIKEKYLKSEPSFPETSCKYVAFGDLDRDGFVYCVYHGSVEAPGVKLTPNMTMEDYKMAVAEADTIREENRKKAEKREKLIAFTAIIAVIAGAISVAMALIPTNKNKTTA